MMLINLAMNLALPLELIKRGLVYVRFLSPKRVRPAHSIAYYCSFQVRENDLMFPVGG